FNGPRDKSRHRKCLANVESCRTSFWRVTTGFVGRLRWKGALLSCGVSQLCRRHLSSIGCWTWCDMLIVNKDKQSKGDDKRTSARLIRRLPLNDSRVHGNPKRHDQNACPLCGERIEKTASGGRRKHSCLECGATLNRGIVCESCGIA